MVDVHENRPWEQVTIRPVVGAISTLVTILSCPVSSF